MIEYIFCKAYSSVEEQTAHNGVVVGSIPTRLKYYEIENQNI